MADKKDIQEPGPGQAVTSVTEVVPHPADASSAPGPYDGLELNRPPVSTNRPDVDIAHSLVAGAGAPTGPPEYLPEAPPEAEESQAADLPNKVTAADRKAASDQAKG